MNAHLKRQLLPERPCRAMSTHAATCQLQELRSGIWPSAVRCAGAHLDFFGHDRPLLRSIDQHQFLELLVLLHREDGRQARLWGGPKLTMALPEPQRKSFQESSANRTDPCCELGRDIALQAASVPFVAQAVPPCRCSRSFLTSGVQAPFLMSSWHT